MVADLNVRRRRYQRPRDAEEVRVAVDGRVGDAVLEAVAVVEELRIGEPIGLALPELADRRDALAVP
jgi:hypothetical protein